MIKLFTYSIWLLDNFYQIYIIIYTKLNNLVIYILFSEVMIINYFKILISFKNLL